MTEWTCPYCGQENPNGDRIAARDPRCIRCNAPKSTREDAIAELTKQITNLEEQYQEVSGHWREARNARDEAQVFLQVAEGTLSGITEAALLIHKQKEIRMDEKAALLSGLAPRRPAPGPDQQRLQA